MFLLDEKNVRVSESIDISYFPIFLQPYTTAILGHLALQRNPLALWRTYAYRARPWLWGVAAHVHHEHPYYRRLNPIKGRDWLLQPYAVAKFAHPSADLCFAPSTVGRQVSSAQHMPKTSCCCCVVNHPSYSIRLILFHHICCWCLNAFDIINEMVSTSSKMRTKARRKYDVPWPRRLSCLKKGKLLHV